MTRIVEETLPFFRCIKVDRDRDMDMIAYNLAVEGNMSCPFRIKFFINDL